MSQQSRIPFARRHAERAEQILPPGYIPPMIEADMQDLEWEDDLTPAAVAPPRPSRRNHVSGVMLTGLGIVGLAVTPARPAYAAATTPVPVINIDNWRVFVGAAVCLILTVTGIQMLAGHRKNSPRKQAEHALSAGIALVVIALGLAGSVGLAWASGVISFFGS